MGFEHFHFAHPLWLVAGIAAPVIGILFFFFYRKKYAAHRLDQFIDSHLLPYLIVQNPEKKERSYWLPILFFCTAWIFLTLALAGPRWSFREVETLTEDQSLVILLDLSESMNAADAKPTRLVRAKQKIEDLLRISKGVKIGLIAFAADPHMLAPLTEDKNTVYQILPSLNTDLIHTQGSRLSSALDMAANLLSAEKGRNKAILVISDGGFEDASAIVTAKKLGEQGIVVHALGIGTIEGVDLINARNQTPHHSKLEKERLNEISIAGNGRYVEDHYSGHEEEAIIDELHKRSETEIALGKKNRFWDERFYLMLLPVIPLFLIWFRKGAIFAALLFFSASLQAAPLESYFLNAEQRGQHAFEAKDYSAAANSFEDPYHKGVAYYRAGNFAAAEKCFKASTRPDCAVSAKYNLGNALAMQQKFKDAIKAYESTLKMAPDHTRAKENLELIKKMQQDQKQKSSDQDKSDSNQSEQEEQESQEKQENQDQEGDQKEPSDKQDNSSQDQQSQDSPEEESDSSEKQEEQHPDNQESDDSEPEGEESESEESESDESENGGEAEPEEAGAPEEEKETAEANPARSQEDLDADLWLNRIESDPQTFLKNKFMIESRKNGTKEGVDPW